jgi:polyisoprenoid-binding protein YceI
MHLAVVVIGLAASAGLWNSTGWAGPKTVRTAQPKAVPAQAGDVDLERSRVYVFVGKTGLGHEHGVEGLLKSGHLDWPAKTGELVFDMTSFDADTPAARKHVGLEGETSESTRKQVNANMLGPAVLNVEKFPTAKFVIDSITPVKPPRGIGLPSYQLDGEFTLHGVTKPLRIVVRGDKKKGMLHVQGRFAVLQTQYGIKPFSKGLGAIGVADELQIWGDLWIHAK